MKDVRQSRWEVWFGIRNNAEEVKESTDKLGVTAPHLCKAFIRQELKGARTYLYR